LALGGTAAGVAALVAFKFHPAGSAATAAGLSAPGPSAPGASPSTTGGAGSVAGAASGVPATGGAPPAGGKPSATAGPGGTSGGGTGQSTAGRMITGAVDNTPYGPMQVAITVAGKKITKVTVLQTTSDGTISQGIDAMAIPKLNSETLTAQSANINAVSGASYTSAGYKQSLQSAIDQAGL
jgi:hypothetical protein